MTEKWEYRNATRIYDESGLEVAQVSAECGLKTMRKRARLIASAPDLHEALQRLDDYYTRPVTVDLSETDEWAQFHRDVLTPARAALAKAKGASC